MVRVKVEEDRGVVPPPPRRKKGTRRGKQGEYRRFFIRLQNSNARLDGWGGSAVVRAEMIISMNKTVFRVAERAALVVSVCVVSGSVVLVCSNRPWCGWSSSERSEGQSFILKGKFTLWSCRRMKPCGAQSTLPGNWNAGRQDLNTGSGDGFPFHSM